MSNPVAVLLWVVTEMGDVLKAAFAQLLVGDAELTARSCGKRSVQIYSPNPATPFSNTESKAHLQLLLITRKTILGAPGDDLLLGIVNDLEPGVGFPI